MLCPCRCTSRVSRTLCWPHQWPPVLFLHVPLRHHLRRFRLQALWRPLHTFAFARISVSPCPSLPATTAAPFRMAFVYSDSLTRFAMLTHLSIRSLAPQFLPCLYGSRSASHVLEVYLDFVCPFSKKQFVGIQKHLLPRIDKSGDLADELSVIFRCTPQPWHASSTFVHGALHPSDGLV